MCILFNRRTGKSIPWIVFASVLVVFGVLCERYVIVLPGLTHPPELFPGMEIVGSGLAGRNRKLLDQLRRGAPGAGRAGRHRIPVRLGAEDVRTAAHRGADTRARSIFPHRLAAPQEGELCPLLAMSGIMKKRLRQLLEYRQLGEIAELAVPSADCWAC